jgi:hypothetical protein
LTKIYQIVPLLPPAFSGVGDYALSLAQNLRDFYHIDSEFIVGDPNWQGEPQLDGFNCHKVSDRSATALATLIKLSNYAAVNPDQPEPATRLPPVEQPKSEQTMQAANPATLAQPNQLENRLNQSNQQDQATDQITVLLHYVGYGYQSRGVPFWLADWLKLNHRHIADRRLNLVTMFHEVYSFGPPWKSEFWLRPWQVRIAKQVIAASSAIFVSNYISAQDVAKHKPQAQVNIYPVWSNFGEPEQAELKLGDRLPTRWLVCGGTATIERGLTSFLQVLDRIPAEFFPTHLDVFGGTENPVIRQLLAQDFSFTTAYFPQVSVAQASSLLTVASFAWIDYLQPQDFFPSLVFKSGIFACCSAHGVLSVFSHQETGATIDDDPHPGVFYIANDGSDRTSFPDLANLGTIRQKVYQWYHRHASARVVARAYADALLL